MFDVDSRNTRSWVTVITTPLKLFTNFSNHSTLVISKWFVGSSNNNTSGLDNNNFAKATLLFSPPDNVPIFLVKSSGHFKARHASITESSMFHPFKKSNLFSIKSCSIINVFISHNGSHISSITFSYRFCNDVINSIPSITDSNIVASLRRFGSCSRYPILNVSSDVDIPHGTLSMCFIILPS